MGARTPPDQPEMDGQQVYVGDINSLNEKRQAMEYKQNFCCSRIKAKLIAPQANDLGLRETRSSCHKARCATCPGSQECCSLFFTLIPTPERICQGIACTNRDFWPSTLSS